MDNRKKRTIKVISLFLLLSFFTIFKLYNNSVYEKTKHLNNEQLEKIESTENNFSFVVVGDTRNSIETFGMLMDNVNKERILFSAIIGDFVFRGEAFRYWFFIDKIKILKKPLLTVVGNHEVAGMLFRAKENYMKFFGDYYYSFTIGNNYFITIDNSNYTIDARQMNWLEEELEKARTYSNRFVFAHVPLYDPRKGNDKIGHSMKDIKVIKKLKYTLDKHEISMLFVSHIHGYFSGKWGKTPFILTGGGGAPLAGDDKSKYFFHYIKVKISGENVDYEVVKIEGAKKPKMDQLVYDFYMFKTGYLIDTLIILSVIFILYFIFVPKIREREKS